MPEELSPLQQDPDRLNVALRELTGREEDLAAWSAAVSQLDVWPSPATTPEDTSRLLTVLTTQQAAGSPVRHVIAHRLSQRTPLGVLLATARMQVSILRPAFWLLSLALLAFGIVIEASQQVPSPRGGSDLLVRVLGPLFVYLGVSLAFRGYRLRTIEWELACPPSAGQLLLARLVIVLGYDIGLGVGLSLVSIANHGGSFLLVTCDWLMPLFLVAGIALLLSFSVAVPLATTLAYGVWLGVLMLGTTTIPFAPVILSLPGEAILGGMGLLFLGLSVWQCQARTSRLLMLTTGYL